MSEPQTVTVTRYEVRVHASNRHAGYGVPVVVYAANRRAAINEAVRIGWSGYASDARVTVDRVVQEVIVAPACDAADKEPTA